ncbi:MAG TPA: hypothetical protein VI727_05300 [Candidatus Brocadiaceae bacterium]|nr:hypothetical protein [Candidatus Brocadiaceae bacterium]
MSRDTLCQLIPDEGMFVECAGSPEDIQQCPNWCGRSRNEATRIRTVEQPLYPLIEGE